MWRAWLTLGRFLAALGMRIQMAGGWCYRRPVFYKLNGPCEYSHTGRHIVRDGPPMVAGQCMCCQRGLTP